MRPRDANFRKEGANIGEESREVAVRLCQYGVGSGRRHRPVRTLCAGHRGREWYRSRTARALASAGATVTIAARDVEAAGRVAADINTSNPDASIAVRQLDLLDRASVDRLVASISGPLDILINKPALWRCRRDMNCISRPTTWDTSG
jgi:short chain dehydrogenase